MCCFFSFSLTCKSHTFKKSIILHQSFTSKQDFVHCMFCLMHICTHAHALVLGYSKEIGCYKLIQWSSFSHFTKLIIYNLVYYSFTLWGLQGSNVQAFGVQNLFYRWKVLLQTQQHLTELGKTHWTTTDAKYWAKWSKGLMQYTVFFIPTVFLSTTLPSWLHTLALRSYFTCLLFNTESFHVLLFSSVGLYWGRRHFPISYRALYSPQELY